MEGLLQYVYTNEEVNEVINEVTERKVLSRHELLELLGISDNNLMQLKQRNQFENRLLQLGWKLTKEEGRGKKSKYTLEKVSIKQFEETDVNRLIEEEGSYVTSTSISEKDKYKTRILNTIIANQDNVNTHSTYMSADLFKALGIKDLPASRAVKMECIEKVFILVRTTNKSFRIAGKRTEGYNKVVLSKSKGSETQVFEDLLYNYCFAQMLKRRTYELTFTKEELMEVLGFVNKNFSSISSVRRASEVLQIDDKFISNSKVYVHRYFKEKFKTICKNLASDEKVYIEKRIQTTIREEDGSESVNTINNKFELLVKYTEEKVMTEMNIKNKQIAVITGTYPSVKKEVCKRLGIVNYEVVYVTRLNENKLPALDEELYWNMYTSLTELRNTANEMVVKHVLQSMSSALNYEGIDVFVEKLIDIHTDDISEELQRKPEVNTFEERLRLLHLKYNEQDRLDGIPF